MQFQDSGVRNVWKCVVWSLVIRVVFHMRVIISIFTLILCLTSHAVDEDVTRTTNRIGGSVIPELTQPLLRNP